MKTKASIIVFSHLSDAQMEMSMGNIESANNRIMFVKYLILRLNDNLDQEIEPEKYWSDFDKNYLSKQKKGE